MLLSSPRVLLRLTASAARVLSRRCGLIDRQVHGCCAPSVDPGKADPSCIATVTTMSSSSQLHLQRLKSSILPHATCMLPAFAAASTRRGLHALTSLLLEPSVALQRLGWRVL